MDRLIKSILSVSLLAIVCANASAQRTSSGELEATVSFTAAPYSIGAEVSVGTYLLYTYAEGGVTLMNRKVRAGSGYDTSFLRLEGYGAWMWRFFGTYSRRFNAYIGGDLFLGWEWLDPFDRLPSIQSRELSSEGYSDGVFIYGLSPRLNLEFFVFPTVALVAGTRVPFTFNSQSSGIVGLEFSVGARLNF